MIGIRHENIGHHQGFEFLKSGIMFRGPSPLAFTGKSSKRGENMRRARPHVAVIVDSTNESTELFNIGRSLHGKDSFNLYAPRFQASRREPVTKPVGLLYCPFTFEGINLKAISL